MTEPQSQEVAKLEQDPKSAQLAEQEQAGTLPALPVKQTEALMVMIQGVTSTPSMTEETIKIIDRLWEMQKESQARDAETAYWAAMPKLQAELPLIPKNGVMHQTNRDKTASWDIPFAKFEDVIAAIRPVMKTHGFSLTFKHRIADDGAIHTTGIVAHKQGHVERDEFQSAPDTSGSKNAIQSVGSARSYGKRYTTGSLLGLAFGGEDDDGESTGAHDDHQSPQQRKSESQMPVKGSFQEGMFETNFPEWESLIKSGDRSIGDILNLASSKGKLTADQLARIRGIK